jgi:hypothetical protein
MNTFGTWSQWTAMLAVGTQLLLGGCSIAQQKPDPAVAAPAEPAQGETKPAATVPELAYRPSRDATAVIEITDAGALRFFDADSGKGLAPCQLCSAALEEKYGPKCTRAVQTPAPICQGTADATIFEFEQVAVTRSRVNPYCIVFYSAGRMVQGPCICKVGETVPPGIVCSKWVP